MPFGRSRWGQAGATGAGRRLLGEELYDQCIDLGGPLLLDPVAASGQEYFSAMWEPVELCERESS